MIALKNLGLTAAVDVSSQPSHKKTESGPTIMVLDSPDFIKFICRERVTH
jgi:hypothetical protein